MAKSITAAALAASAPSPVTTRSPVEMVPVTGLVRHPRNRGYGAALTSGYAASRGDHVMFMDADRQFDVADLRLLAPFVADHDIATLAARFRPPRAATRTNQSNSGRTDTARGQR